MLVCMGLACAGQEKDGETLVGQFEMPQDAALICFDSKSKQPVPINCCKKEINLDDDACDFGGATTKLYAFVTEAILGEVVVVDMDEQHIVGAYSSDESSAFIPVGEKPNDIVATDDGGRIFTANRETGDLSVIRTVMSDGGTVVETPYLAPASTIDLDGSAGRMTLVKQPDEYRDNVALVTQPELGRLAVVALDSTACPKPKKQEEGCLKGYLTLSPEDSEEMIQPYALTDAAGDIVYVGSYNSSVLIAIQLGPLVDAAMEMAEPGEIPSDGVINEVIDIGFTTRQLSIEPRKRRWLYGIDHERGRALAINLEDREAGSGNPIKAQTVSVSGVASSVRVLELAEDDEPNPQTFNGTFAVIMSSNGHISVVDIDDRNSVSEYFRPNRIRSSVDFSNGKGPSVTKPTLSINSERGDKIDSPDDYVGFVEEDAGVGGCDAGDPFRAEYDQGIRLRCDPYQNRTGGWTLAWQGPIGMKSYGVITNITDKDDEPWRMLVTDMKKDFCAYEVFTKDAYPGYPGDRLRILSAPSPLEDEEERCEELYGKKEPQEDLYYRIVGVSKYNEEDGQANVLEFEKIDEESKDLLPECYSQVFEFQIEASDHWTFQSGSVGPRTGTFLPEEETCLYDENDPSDVRVFAGQTYENSQMIFKLEYGEAWRDDPTTVDGKEVETATYSFNIKGGYKSMESSLGVTKVTDIEVMPNSELLLVDQNGEGLVVFDLLSDFASVGRHIY